MNILLIDQPLWNRGDESAHKGLIRNLIKAISNVHIKVLEIDVEQAAVDEFDMKLPQVEFINIHSLNKVWFNRFLGNAYKYRLSWILAFLPTMRKIRRLYKEADYVIMAPGGIDLGGFQNWRHLTLLLLACQLKKPLAYYGRSIGPFPIGNWKQRRFKNLAKYALKYCNYICLRDKQSIKVAEELRISYKSTVDSAFLDSTDVLIPSDIRRMIGNNPYIVFVPNELIWHYAYRNKISASIINGFYNHLLEIIQKYYPDYRVVMLPQINNQVRNDYVYFCELREKASNRESIVIISDNYSSDIQQAIIKHAKLMIGARYHSIVFAINQGIPFISLSYEHKMSGLLEELDETDRMIDITNVFDNQFAIDDAIDKFKTLVVKLKESTEARKKAKDIARRCFKQFLSSLGHSDS